MLSDESWESLAKRMKDTGRVYNKREHRLTLEGIFYRMRTGCSRRDFSDDLGAMRPIAFDGRDDDRRPDQALDDGRLGGREGAQISVRFPFLEQQFNLPA